MEFTPTFLGCPALEVMKRALEEKVTALGAEPEVQVIADDSWSTDKITAAGREKLRAAGFAPPAPREASAPKLVQLQSAVFRCPYCGSTETRLENIFGPTPCRSLRYCETCRQPFEQFKIKTRGACAPRRGPAPPTACMRPRSSSTDTARRIR